ncbi:unnamed protein product [Amaranthus hypochondriacus]
MKWMKPNINKKITSRLVQQISQNGKEIPERYLIKNQTISPAIDASSKLWDDTLLIDLSLLNSQNELAKLLYALNHWGCFQVINHGMTSSFLDELLNASKQFFGLPLDEKLKYCPVPSKDTTEYFNGYANSSLIAGDEKSLNWNDRLLLIAHPDKFRKLQFWPQKPHNFSLRLKTMFDVLLKAMAKSIKLNENSFLNQMDGGVIATRFAMYPRCSCPDRVYGIHPHSDGSTITALLPDKNVPEGLHILNHDQWFKVPVIPAALFVNVGDFGELMSNGIFKSVTHRVVPNSNKERFTVAAFYIPHPDTQVGPVNELISTNQPQLYKSLPTQTYKKLYFEIYPSGKRVIDALKI